MGKGLAFLNLKYWHPTNNSNLQKKWENEQKHAENIKKAKEREIERKREEELARMRTLIAKRSGPESEQYKACILQAPVAFMYTEPPGLKQARERDRERALHAERKKEYEKYREMGDLPRDQLRQMEKEMEGSMTVHEKNISRFAFLKNAPMKDDYCKNIEVHHKPFGMTIRNVKCFKCGEWGHRIGDRECSLQPKIELSFLDSLEEKAKSTVKPAGAPAVSTKPSENNRADSGNEWEEICVDVKKPILKNIRNASSSPSRSGEGSLTSVASSNKNVGGQKQKENEEIEEKPDSNVVEDYRGEFKVEDNVVIKNSKPIYGRYTKTDANQQLVESEEECYESEDESIKPSDLAFVQHLSEHQKREWLRELEKEEKKKRKKMLKSGRKKKKKKKSKHRRKRDSSDSDTSDSSSSRKKRKKKKKKKKKAKRRRSDSSCDSSSDSESYYSRKKRKRRRAH